MENINTAKYQGFSDLEDGFIARLGNIEKVLILFRI